MNPDLSRLLLADDPVVAPVETVETWWRQHRALQAAWPVSIDLAIAAGFAADRVGWAFASAYQAALRALVPELSPDSVTALCVTESGGTAPRAMQCAIGDDGHGGLRLDGAKRWTMLGPEGTLFLVAARDTRTLGERPQIRLVQVPADAPGVDVQAMPPTDFVPEVPHARLRFQRVAVPESALLAGDGYSRYVKPFRSIEDLHVHAAVLAYLLRESRRLDWPRHWIERAIAALFAYRAVAVLDPAAATTHVILAGAMSTADGLVEETEAFWRAASDLGAAARWQRDRRLLALAGAPREARLQRAWAQLDATASASTSDQPPTTTA